jgi:hypothetical protein
MRPLTRVFSGDKIVDSRLLNAVGIQPFRAVAARALDRLTPADAAPEVRAHVSELAADGLLVMRDFLPQCAFAALAAECDAIDQAADHTRATCSGPNTSAVTMIPELDPRGSSGIRAFLNDQRLQAILRAVEKWPWSSLIPYARFEQITYWTAGRDRADDPQTALHADVFHHSHKAWLYLDDVAIGSGPLAYVRGSHRLTAAHVWSLYRDSRRHDRSADPSRRIAGVERERAAAREVIVTCPRNTLVIANVCGYHRRLQGCAGNRRRAVTLSLRMNPFLAHRLRSRLAPNARLYARLREAKRQLTGIAAGRR